MQACPCGSNKNYAECCFLFISGEKIPLTPEQLMRSRYTAYTQANMDYIIQTMKGNAARNFDTEEARIWAIQVKWLKLEVIQTRLADSKGYVEFIAHYTHDHKKYLLHEHSEFVYDNNTWYYVNGSNPSPIKSLNTTQLSRNDPCPCGSHKKFKKCCGFI